MFEMSLVESSGQLRTKSSRYLWITATFNATLIALMMLYPLLYPQALPRTVLSAMLTVPSPPAAAAPPPHPAPPGKAVRVTAALDPFTAPTNIPRTIDRSHEDAPPAISGADTAGMSRVTGGDSGPMGAFSLAAPPLPVVKMAAPKPRMPAHISSGVVAGNKLFGTSPVYPSIAKAAHVSGAVVLHAVISRGGSIESLAVVSGPEMLRASAVSAVQDWRYKPYLLNGEPTEVDTTITVNFSSGS